MKYPLFWILSLSFLVGNLTYASPCSNLEQPVCGSDGRTYGNICLLQSSESVLLEYEGKCFPANFLPANSFSRGVELFDLKKNQLTPSYVSGREILNGKLMAISHWLHSYDFSEDVRGEVVSQINTFLGVDPDKNTVNQLKDSTEALKAAILEIKEKSAQKKYGIGKIPFLDTDEGDWFTPSVAFLKEKNWVSGYKDRFGNLTGKFEPAGLVTKAEVTKMVFRMAGVEKDTQKIPENLLVQNHWSVHWVALAEERGISLWTRETDPNQKATRAEVLRLIYEVLGLTPDTYTQSDFPDVSPSDIYFPYIQSAKDKGIVSGYPDGYFRPDENVSRAEMAKIIKKSFETLGSSPIFAEKITQKSGEKRVLPQTALPEKYEKYATVYTSTPFEFRMKVPGFFHFKSFPSQENEIMRFGFSQASEVTESDVDFWLKIIGTEVPVTRFIQKKISDQVILEFPREGFSKSFFRLEGSQDFSQIMYFLQASIEYQKLEQEPVIQPASLEPVVEKLEIPSTILENLEDRDAFCEGQLLLDESGVKRCYTKTSDIGSSCYAGDMCESGFCMAPQNGGVEGACYGEKWLSGCVKVINQGVVTEVCD